jgi:hypothetical protein
MSNGRETTTAMEVFLEDLDGNMEHLTEHIDVLPSSQQNFAQSLCDWYSTKGYLSAKQKEYALKFWQAVNEAGADDGSKATIGVVLPPRDAALRVVALFDKAAEELKYPHVTYWIGAKEVVAEVDSVRLWRTGAKSRYGVGHIAAAWRKDASTDPVYLFIIYRDTGVVEYTSFVTAKPELVLLLNRLITNFSEELKISGKRMLTCCYCGKELTAGASLEVGYGPVCASKWGLPWGTSESSESNEVGTIRLEDL